jgi:hypothetical protein
MPIVKKVSVPGSTINASLWSPDAARGQTEPRVSISSRHQCSALRAQVQRAQAGNYQAAYISTWMDISEARGFYKALGEVLESDEAKVVTKEEPDWEYQLDEGEPAPSCDPISYVAGRMASGQPVKLRGRGNSDFYVKGIGPDGVKVAAGAHRTAKQLNVPLDSIVVG